MSQQKPKPAAATQKRPPIDDAHNHTKDSEEQEALNIHSGRKESYPKELLARLKPSYEAAKELSERQGHDPLLPEEHAARVLSKARDALRYEASAGMNGLHEARELNTTMPGVMIAYHFLKQMKKGDSIAPETKVMLITDPKYK